MMTDIDTLPEQTTPIPELVREPSWPRAVAAGSLVASAVLLLSGRRKGALAAALAGAAIATLEKPELFREIWDNTPKYLRAGQDFLLRAEDVVEDLHTKGERLRGILNKAASSYR
ncbi:MAG TPA: hypothetical protein VGT04_11505 [Acidobacteriaceae bacterium]|nr:hypothetical protein [Acidobacteriaceae bacterium]